MDDEAFRLINFSVVRRVLCVVVDLHVVRLFFLVIITSVPGRRFVIIHIINGVVCLDMFTA
jgi:hypothetical protein